MMETIEIKVWEHDPMGFASIRDKLMAFCYEHKCAPDDVLISPYVEMDGETIVQMGIRLTLKEDE